MKLGELFVRLKLAPDAKNGEALNKFRAGLVGLKDKANDFRKQAQAIAKEKLGDFFKESEFASLGFLGRLTDMIGKANLARIAILTVVGALVKLTSSAAESAEHLFKFALNTGMSTTALQRWQMQAQQAGVDAEEVASSLSALQQKAMDIQLNRGDAGAFQVAGVSWFADAETQLRQIEQMLATRPAALGTKLAMDMGLSEDMITFLRLRSTLKPIDEGLILSPKEIDELKSFSIDFKSTLAAFQNALKKIGAMVLPITRPLMDFARRLMRVGTEIIGWMTAIEARRNIILGMISAIGAALAVAFFPATATIGGILLGIGAVLLLVEDIATFIRGGDSITGRMWDGIKKGFKKIIEAVKKDWTVLIDWFVASVGKFVDILVAPILKALELVGLLKKPDFSGAEKTLTAGWQYIKTDAGKDLSAFWDRVANFFSPIAPAISGGQYMPAACGANSNQNIQIQINGAQDPSAIANEIKMKLQKQTSDAVYQMPRQEN